MGSSSSSLLQDDLDYPIDLLECILDNLDGDKVTLASCTLVCHSLLKSSRYRLFRHMNRRGKGSFLQDLKSHPFPHLVRVVELYAFGQEICTRHVLPQIFSLLPNIDELKLLGLRSRCISGVTCQEQDRKYETSFRGTIQLRRLEFSHSYHDSYTLFLDFLGLFHSIGTLHINCDAMLDPVLIGPAMQQELGTFVRDAAPSRLQIRAARVHASTAAITSRLLFHVLLVTPSVHTLRALHVTFDSAADLRVCAALLPHCINLRKVHFGQWVTFDHKGTLKLVLCLLTEPDSWLT